MVYYRRKFEAMARKIVAGNWKMNKFKSEAFELAMAIAGELDQNPEDVQVILAPPSLYLSELAALNEKKYALAAQNCHFMPSGAYTGEISATMLKNLGISYCILGHSERRQYFHERDEEIAKKMVACLEQQITPILCVGESLEERNNLKHFVTVLHQLQMGLFHLTPEAIKKAVVAYEPVWAIGTGVTATSEQAQEMHLFIRKNIANHFGEEIAMEIPILYGGSVNASNAAELFSCEDVDGGLVGGASLKANEFLQIIRSF
jgi:triosephosphate isomerase